MRFRRWPRVEAYVDTSRMPAGFRQTELDLFNPEAP